MDLEIAKREFIKYVSNYDTTSFHIKRKLDHSLRVMETSKKIAENLDLNEEEIELAELIGLLHDIGKIEQIGNESIDKKYDHGDFGVVFLKEGNFIRKFIEKNKYDQIIYTAIRNHNKFEIEEGLTEKQLLFSQIIRDADKLDILYQATYLTWKDEVELIENDKLKKEDITPFIEKKSINGKKNLKQMGKIKSLLIRLSFVYGINFGETFKMLKENDYTNKIVNRFDFKDKETKQLIAEVRNAVNAYIDNKQKG